MSATEVGGLKIFNEQVGVATEAEMAQLPVEDIATELHLLRHYRQVPEDYIRILVGQEYQTYDPAQQGVVTKLVSVTDIEQALATVGSKFMQDRLGRMQTPRELLNIVQIEAMQKAREDYLYWFDAGFAKKTYLTIQFFRDIGTQGVVALNDIYADQLTRLTTAPRGKLAGDDFLVYMIRNFSCPEQRTEKVSVIIGWVKGDSAPAVFSAFPGELTPDFPRDNQTPEEQAYNTQFWNTHAFIT